MQSESQQKSDSSSKTAFIRKRQESFKDGILRTQENSMSDAESPKNNVIIIEPVSSNEVSKVDITETTVIKPIDKSGIMYNDMLDVINNSFTI